MFFAKLLGAFLGLPFVTSHSNTPCDVRAQTETGWVCGLRRWSENGQIYASFRGVPYAEQPVGKLRFKELQPHEPWKHDFDARYEGPVCPQHDQLYELITKPDAGMSEACIHANIHVPLHALPRTEKDDENNVEPSKYEYDNMYENNAIFHFGEKSEKETKDEKTKHIKHENDKKQKQDKHDDDNSVRDFSEHHPKDQLNHLHEMTKYPDYAEFNPSSIFPQYKNNEGKPNDNTFLHDGLNKVQDPKSQFFDLLTFLEKSYENNKGFTNEPKGNPKNDETVPINTWYNQEEHDTDKPVYFRPYIENFNTNGKGIDYILKSWPEFHRKEMKHTKSDRNKRHGDKDNTDIKQKYEKKLLPILVFVHGGGFYTGSGDADLHGPEYLVSKDVIVITFNFRINVFGFLSLNTSSVPGNAALRDQITLLRWVQKNAKNFGGDPENVTLMGQSSGATLVHLLSLSDAAKGLFKRVFLLSGTAYQAYYTTSPIYAATVRTSFLAYLGITTVDPEEIHQILIHMPLKRILEANSLLQRQYGLITFSPVVESRFPGVTTVVDQEPEISIAEGRDKDYPFVIGCTPDEAETFRRRLGYEGYPSRVIANPRNLVPSRITFTAPSNVSLALGEKLKHRCFEDHHDVDGVIKCYTEALFVYQAFRLARERAQMEAAPTYLYQFSYVSDLNLVQEGLKLKYKGVAHIEDLTYIFRMNSLLDTKPDFPLQNRDDMMKDWMTSFVVNFMHCSDPTCNKSSHKTGWPHVTKDHLVYEDIEIPYEYKVKTPTDKLDDIIRFYDKIYEMSKNYTLLEETQP